MALSLSWAILGINREQLKTRVFGQRIDDVFFCLSCNFVCLQSQKQYIHSPKKMFGPFAFFKSQKKNFIMENVLKSAKDPNIFGGDSNEHI